MYKLHTFDHEIVIIPSAVVGFWPCKLHLAAAAECSKYTDSEANITAQYGSADSCIKVSLPGGKSEEQTG